MDKTYVDLGLPSGTLWATCNVGANSPEERGDYFAWGETQPKTFYALSNYKYSYGRLAKYAKLKKYCIESDFGNNGFTDNLTTLLPSDDAATANWGSDWCMPSADQWRELQDNTKNAWTIQNGVLGRLFTASNGNSLFLPAAGYRLDNRLYSVGSTGNYWSSSLYTDDLGGAWFFKFSLDYYHVSGGYRDFGNPVRAVCSAQDTHVAQDTHEYVDLGLPSGTLWATCNVGATTPEGYGDYFAWGEIQPKTVYSGSTYEFTDNLTTLVPSDDAATANWGNEWRMPSAYQWIELQDNTDSAWTTQNGVNGRLFTASNGHSLFLPAAGSRWGDFRLFRALLAADYRRDDNLHDVGSYGKYWSSSLYTGDPCCAWHFRFDSGDYYYVNYDERYCGLSIRAVRSARQK